MDLTFQVPMQYCSLQHQTLISSPVTSTTGCQFCFDSVCSLFMELFLHWPLVAYWAPTNLHLSVSYFFFFFLPFHTVHGVLKAIMLKWFAIPFSSAPYFVRTLHHDPCCIRPPKMDGHSGEFWQNIVHWRREWQTTSVSLPWESHEQYEKAKR